ncbi:hypothetical protein EDC94DRAFT_610718 [Helicostylum pulchrum]|uniref:Uncharacterized protein n=1 Tax=Helicostylum pulchrum TaxID=562976 RepID=A0ABP9Y9N1_9FUNG|nr:hypothetical protein EDC94DRAFT_610718 [Helicostylum pulchrum]
MLSNTTPTLTQQEDFPVGFAEHKDTDHQMNDDTVFYVEWLDNSSEFPSLSAPNETNFTRGTWELLQRKEINGEDEHTLIPVEGDACWSKLSTPGLNELYVDVAEKNAELKPTKRTVQPLWSEMSVKKKTVKQGPVTDEDLYQDDLGSELLNNQKTQSRRANRLGSRRQLHDLKTVDIHVEGILKLATTRLGKTNITWVPYEKKQPAMDREERLAVEEYFYASINHVITSKPDALRFSSRFSQNVKRSLHNYSTSNNSESKRPLFPDNSEFSVHSHIFAK